MLLLTKIWRHSVLLYFPNIPIIFPRLQLRLDGGSAATNQTTWFSRGAIVWCLRRDAVFHFLRNAFDSLLCIVVAVLSVALRTSLMWRHARPAILRRRAPPRPSHEGACVVSLVAPREISLFHHSCSSLTSSSRHQSHCQLVSRGPLGDAAAVTTTTLSRTARYFSSDSQQPPPFVPSHDNSANHDHVVSPDSGWENWKRRTERVLASSSSSSLFVPSDGHDDDEHDESVSHASVLLEEAKRCLFWWRGQQPVTEESVLHVWKLWNVIYRQLAVVIPPPNRVQDEESSWRALFHLVLDHWRLAASLHDIVLAEYSPWNVYQTYRDDSRNKNKNNNNRPSFCLWDDKAYTLLFSATAQAIRAAPPSSSSSSALETAAWAQTLLEHHLVETANTSSSSSSSSGALPEGSNRLVYNGVLECWAQAAAVLSSHARTHTDSNNRNNSDTGVEHAVRQSLYWLRTLREGAATVPDLAPDGATYEHVMETLCHRSDHHFDWAQLAELYHEACHNQCVKDEVLYWWIVAHVRRGDLRGAEEILQHAVADYLQHVIAIREGPPDQNNDNQTPKGTDNRPIPTPNRQCFAAIMHEYGKRGNPVKAHELLQLLYDLYEASDRQNDKLLPTAMTLNGVLNSYVPAQQIPHRAQKAQDVLEAFHELSSRYGNLPSVDRVSYNTVMNAWAEDNDPQNIERAQALLRAMQGMDQETLQPDSHSYTVLMKAWSRSHRREAIAQCRALLQTMWDAYRAGDTKVKPTAFTYSTLLTAYSRFANTNEQVEEAEACFMEMWDLYENKGDEDFCPMEPAYVALITTLNRSRNRANIPARAAHYFHHMYERYKKGDQRLHPSVVIFNTVIDSHRVTGDGSGAEAVLQWMIDGYRQGNHTTQPTTVSFNTVMTVWSKSRNPEAPSRVENILRSMESLAGQEGWDCRPQIQSFTILLECWAKQGSEAAAERAESILWGMQNRYDATGDVSIRPDNHCYTSVLNAWSRAGSRNAADRAQALFGKMMERYESGDEDLRPGPHPCIALISAWSRSNHPMAAARTLAILDEMEERHKREPEKFDFPDAHHFSAVINAYAELGDAEEASAILRRIQETTPQYRGPNRACFNAVIKAFARANLPDSPDRAQAIFQELMSEAKNGGGAVEPPDIITYTMLMNVWRKSRRPEAFEKCNELLQLMLNGRRRVRPDDGTFNVMFKTLTDSTLPNKQLEAETLVDTMNALRIRSSRATDQLISKLLRQYEP